jgi:hypothetical protein
MLLCVGVGVGVVFVCMCCVVVVVFALWEYSPDVGSSSGYPSTWEVLPKYSGTLMCLHTTGNGIVSIETLPLPVVFEHNKTWIP